MVCVWLRDKIGDSQVSTWSQCQEACWPLEWTAWCDTMLLYLWEIDCLGPCVNVVACVKLATLTVTVIALRIVGKMRRLGLPSLKYGEMQKQAIEKKNRFFFYFSFWSKYIIDRCYVLLKINFERVMATKCGSHRFDWNFLWEAWWPFIPDSLE